MGYGSQSETLLNIRPLKFHALEKDALIHGCQHRLSICDLV